MRLLLPRFRDLNAGDLVARCTQLPKSGSASAARSALWRGVRLGLVARIFVLIGLILSVYAGGEIYNGLGRRASAEAELRSRASSLAGIAALDVGRTFEAARHAMTVLANTQAIRDRDLATFQRKNSRSKSLI
jgi:hypothetical protein